MTDLGKTNVQTNPETVTANNADNEIRIEGNDFDLKLSNISKDEVIQLFNNKKCM